MVLSHYVSGSHWVVVSGVLVGACVDDGVLYDMGGGGGGDVGAVVGIGVGDGGFHCLDFGDSLSELSFVGLAVVVHSVIHLTQ